MTRGGYLGLGSNLGERRAALELAAQRLPSHGVQVQASSSVYETQPVGELPDQPRFYNACLRVRTSLDPEAVLEACQDIERQAGRRPGGPRHGPRALDIDVLLLDDAGHHCGALEVPHPALLERRFVLIALLELDFELRTPAGVRLADALAALPVSGQDVRRAGPRLARAGGARREAAAPRGGRG